MPSEQLVPVSQEDRDEINWKAVAHRAMGHIDCLLLYATSYPGDSHPRNANTFLVELRRELGITEPHRTQGQFKEGISLPLPRISPQEPSSEYRRGIEDAAKWHDAQAANAEVRYKELDRYSDCADERIGWRSWKDANDRHRHHAAVIRQLAEKG